MFVRLTTLAVCIIILFNTVELSDEHELAVYLISYLAIGLDFVVSMFKD